MLPKVTECREVVERLFGKKTLKKRERSQMERRPARKPAAVERIVGQRRVSTKICYIFYRATSHESVRKINSPLVKFAIMLNVGKTFYSGMCKEVIYKTRRMIQT